MRIRSASALLTLAFCLAGCEEALPPGTTMASAMVAAQAPAADEAMITFYRPTSPCDAGEYAIVTDARGHFVGNVAPGTQVSFPTRPGTHTFYAWSSVDLIVDKDPNFTGVSAVRVHAPAGEPTAILLDTPKPCGARLSFEMVWLSVLRHAADRRSGVDEEITDLQRTTSAVIVDRVAGQVALDSRPAHLRTFLALGDRRLQQIDITAAARQRHAELQRELPVE